MFKHDELRMSGHGTSSPRLLHRLLRRAATAVLHYCDRSELSRGDTDHLPPQYSKANDVGDVVRATEYVVPFTKDSATRAAVRWRTPLPERIPGILEILPLEGEIDLHVSSRVAKSLGSLVPANIIVDLRDVSYIDSSGLAVLIEAMQIADEGGAQFGLVGLAENVRPIFEIARLDRVFSIVPDIPEAFARFRTVSQRQADAMTAPHVEELNDELMAHFAKKPELLYKINPRQFEQVVMSILGAMGYRVEHVGGSGDGGRDILASRKTPLGTLLVVVQCKRYSFRDPIPPDMVRSFMFVVNDYDKATSGLLVTTSRFGPDSLAIQQEYQYRLQLADFDRLRGWLSDYGQWKASGSSHLWTPDYHSSVSTSEEKRASQWRCLQCGQVKDFREPVPQHRANTCDRCEGFTFEASPDLAQPRNH